MTKAHSGKTKRKYNIRIICVNVKIIYVYATYKQNRTDAHLGHTKQKNLNHRNEMNTI